MTTTHVEKLFTPAKLGALNLEHRVVMAPLTRLRSTQPGDVPNDMMSEYYGQRASRGGFIISEATTVSVNGRGYLGAPGIYSDEQVEGWRKVVDAVHARGGLIFLQLWHVGRVSHNELGDGRSPIAPSAIPFESTVYTAKGWVPPSAARELPLDEIPTVIEYFHKGAERAKVAGFDGVEIHSGNGYLFDQFLQDGSNQRTDAYGGSIENRARLLLEVTLAVTSVWGPDRVGVRISPSTKFNAMFDSNPEALFAHVAQKLDELQIAYLHVIEPRINGSQAIEDGLPPVASMQLRKIFHNTLIAAGGFEPETAESIIKAGDADMVAFGRHFISNPDLPHRIREGIALSAYDRNTFYGGDAHGYTDYPFSQAKVTSAVSA